MTDTLTPAQARRIALAAQGFTDPKPAGAITMRHVGRVLSRIGLLQIDSVNVVQRAHYVPLFSRLGPYSTDLLDRAAGRAPRSLFEYWGHEASLLPVRLHPYLRWRMTQAREHAWGGMRSIAQERPDLVAEVLALVHEHGPITAAELELLVAEEGKRSGNWGWNWSLTKRALEWLFWCGEVTSARRNGSFARVYDVPERVLPASVLAVPDPDEPAAIRELVRVASSALGIATEAELRDYFRLPVAATRLAVAELVEADELRPVTVPGWRARTYLHRDARLPRRVNAAALISPFDPLVWERARAERLFGFRYRIEIYTPAAQRVHGYYVLPFLLGDALVARVDLKADRRAGVLQVPGAWGEVNPDGPPAARTADGRVAVALASALRSLAEWLGLADVAAPERGDLARELTVALAARGGG